MALFATTPVLFTGCDNPISSEKEDLTDSVIEVSEVPSEEISSENNTYEDSATVGYIKLDDDMDSADLLSQDDDSVISKVFNSEPVTVYSVSSDYAYISYGGMLGKIEAKYISFSKPEEIVLDNSNTEAPTVADDTSPVNDSSLDTQKSGDNIIINNIIFFVDSDGIKIAKPLSFTSYKEINSSGEDYWCSTTSCYIYSQPDTSSYKREANMLYYGDQLKVYGDVNEWYYIGTDSGSGYELHGYVKKEYVTKGFSNAEPENYNATQGKVTAGSANVRSTPSKADDSNILFSVSKGDTFTVLDYDGYWYHIVINGTECYISHKMVEVW